MCSKDCEPDTGTNNTQHSCPVIIRGQPPAPGACDPWLAMPVVTGTPVFPLAPFAPGELAAL